MVQRSPHHIITSHHPVTSSHHHALLYTTHHYIITLSSYHVITSRYHIMLSQYHSTKTHHHVTSSHHHALLYTTHHYINTLSSYQIVRNRSYFDFYFFLKKSPSSSSGMNMCTQKLYQGHIRDISNSFFPDFCNFYFSIWKLPRPIFLRRNEKNEVRVFK